MTQRKEIKTPLVSISSTGKIKAALNHKAIQAT